MGERYIPEATKADNPETFSLWNHLRKEKL